MLWSVAFAPAGLLLPLSDVAGRDPLLWGFAGFSTLDATFSAFTNLF